MSSNNEDNPPSPTNRRASIAGSRLSELFGRTPPMTNGTSPFPGPIAAAAAQQANQRRRMSIATVGLGVSPNQTSPFHTRTDSFSSNGSGLGGESAIDDSGDAAGMTPPSGVGGSSFARRLSFGARSMASISGPSPISTTPPSKPRAAFTAASRLEESHEEDSPSQAQTLSSPTSSTASNFFNRRTGEGNGFNWSTEMRNRAQRSSSITSPGGGLSGGGAGGLSARFPQKSASVSAAPVAPPPPAVKQQAPPDHFQERILKGDFYMD